MSGHRAHPIAFAALGLAGAAPVCAGHFESTGSGLTEHWSGMLALAIFPLAFLVALAEEFFDLRKSKPMLLAAGAIWALAALGQGIVGGSAEAGQAIRHSLLQVSEVMLFLLVTMTYINALDERRAFSALRSRLARRGISYRRLFWLTGLATFCLSPLIDNLNAALLMGAVVLPFCNIQPGFVVVATINIVVAANAGGVFSPFGDLTTLIAWQHDVRTPQGPLGISAFLHLLPPAVVAFLVPALLMQRTIPEGRLQAPEIMIEPRRGVFSIIGLFLATVATTIAFDSWLHLPPVIGMMTGLSFLQFFGYYLKKTHRAEEGFGGEERMGDPIPLRSDGRFDVFQHIARAEWDAILFLCGVALSIGGLAYIGFLTQAERLLYGQLGPTLANLVIGIYSGAIENVTTILGVIAMDPQMSLGQWLLAIFATGIGGSLLSVGSAAGVALMGQARGCYTFVGHLRWTPAILAGFALGIATHFWLNSSLFS